MSRSTLANWARTRATVGLTKRPYTGSCPRVRAPEACSFPRITGNPGTGNPGTGIPGTLHDMKMGTLISPARSPKECRETGGNPGLNGQSVDTYEL